MSKKPYRLVEQEVDRLETKIRKHRLKVVRTILILTVLGLAVAAILYYLYQNKSYDGFQVLESVEREDSAGTRFAEFQGNILKYSNDGAFYIDSQNQLIWNQTYEMQSPMLDLCEGYAAIGDVGGNKIYIMDTQAPCGEIETTRPIQQVHVANQGTVAVLMEENGTGYIQLFDRSGVSLAEGELHAKNSGYPLDIAISNDGKKLAVAMLDVNEGSVKTTVAFYNFGSVGQNEIDNIVSSYPYGGVVIPRVEFLTNDVAVAVGDSRVIFYEGSQKPVEKETIELEREIRSLFYNDGYLGLVFENENSRESYRLEVYDTGGRQVAAFDFSTEYDAIEFLENDEICIRNRLECSIYTLRGIRRFHYNFDRDLCMVIHTAGRQYLFLMSGTTEKIKLQ